MCITDKGEQQYGIQSDKNDAGQNCHGAVRETPSKGQRISGVRVCGRPAGRHRGGSQRDHTSGKELYYEYQSHQGRYRVVSQCQEGKPGTAAGKRHLIPLPGLTFSEKQRGCAVHKEKCHNSIDSPGMPGEKSAESSPKHGPDKAAGGPKQGQYGSKSGRRTFLML